MTRLGPFLSTFLIGLTLPAGLTWACANYSQTELDDIAVRQALATSDDRAFQLVSRKFPHHGRAYWVALEAESRAKLGRSDDGSVGAQDDLAVAVLKQGRYAEARGLLLDLERDRPGRYRTLSNLGVLEKKAGNYALAASYLERALQVEPLGHMGLGDYYLQAARWQAKAKHGAPEANFLGQPYAELASPERVDRTYLETLIHNDREFPDVYLVFGDLLLEEQPLLAGYAYAQARRRGHPASEVLDARFERTRARIAELTRREVQARSKSKRVPTLVSAPELEETLSEWLERFEAWNLAFERRQEALLEGGTAAASLEAVHAGLETAEIGPEVATPYLLAPEEERSPGWTVEEKAGVLSLLALLGSLLGLSLARRARAR